MRKDLESSYASLFPRGFLSHLKLSITHQQVFLKKDSSVIFVCGAASQAAQITLRDKFMEYANMHLANFRFFKAEVAITVLKEKNKDLLELERKFLDYCDCIILVLESRGAVAELGAFTMQREVAKLVLAINDIKYEGEKSFINYGPLARADKFSQFKPTIFTNFDSILMCVEDVKERLERIKKRRDVRIDLSNHSKYKTGSGKNRMLFLADLIHLFSPIKTTDLGYLLNHIYGERRYDFRVEIAMMRALKLLEEHDFSGEKYLVRSLDDRGLFFRFHGINEYMYRGHILNYYHKKEKKRADILRMRVSV